MAQQFKGVPKAEHDKLRKAAHMYTTLTGESLDVSGIPVAEDTEDEKGKAERAKRELDRQAEVTRLKEESDQKLRQLNARAGQDEVQDENPGPGQPAMVTERAKAQGVSRKGEEPDIAKPKR